MPFLDGLELARVVRRAMPWVRVIFLSGHDEFEYAQQAVSLHADAYLLKPIDSTQLIATLEQVAARIEQEQQQYLSAAQRGRSEQEEDALREHFFNQLLSGGISTAQAIEHGARFGAALTARQYLVCMMRLPKDRDTRMQVRALASHTFDGQDDVFCFFRGSTRLMLLLLGESEEAVREHAYEVCQNLRHEIHKVLGPDTLTAIGLKLASGLLALSGGIKIFALFFTMLACIILGMGVPTTANYVIMATITAPIVVKLGVDLLAAHMFVFYFGIVADITPPVALAAYAGSAIAKSNPMKTGVTATRIAIAAFIVPYVFAFSPEMLLLGAPVHRAVQIAVTSFIGMYGVAVGMEGFMQTKLNWPQRLFCIACGLMLIDTGVLTDIVGITGIAVMTFLQRRAVRQTA